MVARVGLGAAVAWASAGPPGLLAADLKPGRLTVKVDQPGVKIGPMHFGLMTEEINHSYDGGLYAELVRNRTFKDDPKTPAHWSVVASPARDGDHHAGRRRPGQRHGPDDQPAAGHRHGGPGAARGGRQRGLLGHPGDAQHPIPGVVLRPGRRRLRRPADRGHREQRRQDHGGLREHSRHRREMEEVHRHAQDGGRDGLEGQPAGDLRDREDRARSG